MPCRSGADCASGVFSAGAGGKLPRPAPLQRAGPAWEVSFAGRSAVPTRTMRTRIAAQGPSMQLPCRRLRRPRRVLRHGRRPLVRRAMASRLRWLSVKPDNPMPGCLPAPRPPRSPRQRRLRSRTLLCPVVPREPSDGLATPPRCRVRMLPRRQDSTHPAIRSRRLAYGPHGASVPHAGASPRPLRNALAFRKRHPSIGIPQWMPRPTQDFRLPSGLPESPPTMLHKGSSKLAPE